MTKSWVRLHTIPSYLIQSIGDSGMVETYDDQGKMMDSDDLRIAIELSGGTKIVIDANARLIFCANGDVRIEALVEDKE